jgi:hypothetical protein
VGNPGIGEGYVHELVHAILGPTFPSRSSLFAEGVATWLGGSRGRTPQEVFVRLRQIQIAHPALTFGQVLAYDIPNGTPEDRTDAFYATGALIVDTVYRRTGIAGLRALAQLNRDPNILQAALPAQLGLANSDHSALDQWWRAEAARKSVVR